MMRWLLMLPFCAAGFAQQRFDLTPLAGYRSPFSVTAEYGESAANARFSEAGSVGVAFGVRFDDTALVEFRFARQNTSTVVTGSTVAAEIPGISSRLDQFHADFTREFPPPGEPKLRPFLMASLGMTRLSLAAEAASRFSFGIGGGLKYFPVRWLGLRVQGEWLPIWLNPQVKSLACAGGCVVVLGGKLANQFEVSLGPTISF